MLRNIPYLEIFRTPAELAVVFMAQEAGTEHFHPSIFPRIFVCKIINWKKLYRFTAIKEVYAFEKCCFLEDKGMQKWNKNVTKEIKALHIKNKIQKKGNYLIQRWYEGGTQKKDKTQQEVEQRKSECHRELSYENERGAKSKLKLEKSFLKESLSM